MQKRVISALLAALAAAGGAFYWWQQKKPGAGASSPASAGAATQRPRPMTDGTGHPAPSQAPKREVPPPDSAEEGRTPYYFVPGEALVALRGQVGADGEGVAALFDARHLPIGDEAQRVAYPAPESEEWITVFRIRWDDSDTFERSLARFVEMEKRIGQGFTWQDRQIIAWMPNWLGSVAAAERLYTPGGPAAYPRPVAASPQPLAFADAPFLQEWREQAQHPVTLAVLDTFPTRERLAGRTLSPALAGVAEGILQEKDTRLSVDASKHFATFRGGHPFDMSDHGLMAAWLAMEVIGPEAMAKVKVESVRIATEEGVCSAADVIAGLAPLATRAREQGEIIVALLAFVIGMGDIIPPRIRAYEEHYEPLRLACLSLSESGGTLLGAAGNDATGLQHPPRTRIPAAFRSVIEVSAGQLNQPGLALYANQAKALCLFGGETNLQYETADNIPALVGPAVASELRASADTVMPNESGWVAWAGTSFAAALAAGLAVLLRSQHPEYKMWDVRTQLRQLATDTRNPGNVPFIDLVRPPAFSEQT